MRKRDSRKTEKEDHGRIRERVLKSEKKMIATLDSRRKHEIRKGEEVTGNERYR